MVGWPKAGALDFVCAWYRLGGALHESTRQRTHAVCLREHQQHLPGRTGLGLAPLLAQGIKVHLAHRTFRWNNDARGIAAVHCVIVGFGDTDISRKRIFSYADACGEATEEIVSNINPYLVDGGMC